MERVKVMMMIGGDVSEAVVRERGGWAEIAAKSKLVSHKKKIARRPPNSLLCAGFAKCARPLPSSHFPAWPPLQSDDDLSLSHSFKPLLGESGTQVLIFACPLRTKADRNSKK